MTATRPIVHLKDTAIWQVSHYSASYIFNFTTVLPRAGHFTVEKIRGSLREKGVYSKIAEVLDNFGSTLDIPLSKRAVIRQSPNLDNAARLDKVIAYVVETHPYGSWRLIIWALDEMRCPEDADAIRAYAEPVGM